MALYLALKKEDRKDLYACGDLKSQFIVDISKIAAYIQDGWEVLEFTGLKRVTGMEVNIKTDDVNAPKQPPESPIASN